MAALGGSSTFGTGVSDADSWPFLLQGRLGERYEVLNFGVPGYSTAEAIVQLALLVPESRPRVVVMYEGWNDLRNYHDPNLGSDYYSHGLQQFGNLGIAPPAGEPLPLARLSATAWFARQVALRLRGREPATPAAPALRRTPDPFVDRIYGRNLATMKALVRALGAHAVFVPQVLDRAEFAGQPGAHPWAPRLERDAVPGLLERFNRILLAACRPHEAGCTVLRVQDERWEPGDFVDAVHLSPQGGDKLARLVERHVRGLDH